MGQRGRGEERPSLEERIDELQRVVSVLVHKLERDFDTRLDFTPRSIPYVDAVLTEMRRSGRELTPGLFLSIGGYVGETLLRSAGGQWADLDGMLCVRLDGVAHMRYVRIFDWVQDAYEDPRTQSLTYRMGALMGSGRAWDPDEAGSGVAAA